MDIIFYSTSDDFNTFHRRREIEAIADSIGYSGKVIYFNRPQFLFSKRTVISRNVNDKIIIKNLFTLFPLTISFNYKFFLLLFVKLPILIQINIVRFFNRIKKSNCYNWYYKPDQYLYLPKNKCIYLHYDNYKDDSSYFFSKRKDFDLVVRKCVSNSVFSLFCSKKLIIDLNLNSSENVFYYPNAIDRKLIPKVSKELCNVSLSLDTTVGFVGQIDDSFDDELLGHLVKYYSEYKFLLIGPISNKRVEILLNKHANVVALGYVEYNSLYKYISKFDIGICPYKFNVFNSYRNPLKVYEFFSFGLPVVSTTCDIDVNAYSHMSRVNNVNSFIDAIKYELDNNTEEKMLWRMDFASNNCWDNRAKFVLDKLRSFCELKI